MSFGVKRPFEVKEIARVRFQYRRKAREELEAWHMPAFLDVAYRVATGFREFGKPFLREACIGAQCRGSGRMPS